MVPPAFWQVKSTDGIAGIPFCPVSKMFTVKSGQPGNLGKHMGSKRGSLSNALASKSRPAVKLTAPWTQSGLLPVQQVGSLKVQLGGVLKPGLVLATPTSMNAKTPMLMLTLATGEVRLTVTFGPTENLTSPL